MKIAEIYLNQKNKRIDKIYDYLIPDEFENDLKNGMRVLVNFGRGNRELEGFVVHIRRISRPERKLKPILQLIDQRAVLNNNQIKFCKWMKTYYCNLFYENLAYFLSSLPLIRDRILEPGIKSNTLDYKIATIFQTYFTQNQAINYQKIKKKDQSLVNQMIASGELIEKKRIRVYPQSKEKIYYLKNNLIEKNKQFGSIQKKILSLLKLGEIKESTLKQFIPQYRKSIASLIKKGVVGQTVQEDDSNTEKNISLDQTRDVILSERENSIYKHYQEIKNQYQGCFFLCNDQVAKYRIIFKLIEDQLKDQKSVLILFPDINLTYQRLELFYKYFGETLVFFHHNLKASEQRNIYESVYNNKARLIIGVQGALFLPFKELGLIIVDDDHSQSYHSMGSPKYHIPDLVENYAHLLKIDYILMDEIPRIKTWYDVTIGKLGLVKIGEVKQMHGLKTIDMHEQMLTGNFSIISRQLDEMIGKTLKAQKLSVLLINRTGYSNGIVCRACGKVLKCPNCKLALKYNHQTNTLTCNYCDYKKIMLQNCPNCGKKELRHMGIGIDQFRKILNERFPKARIVTVQGGLSLIEIKQINEALKNKQIDILIGTQVLVKHFSFQNIGLAACLLIDRDLNLGEFDAAEISYQIYSRFFKKAFKYQAEGIIQTNEPQNDTILSILENNFESYYQTEIQFRKVLKYPPFFEMIEFKIFHQYNNWASNDALRFFILLRDYCHAEMAPESYYLYKPNDRGIDQRGKCLVQIILKCKDLSSFQKMMASLIKNGEIESIKSNITFKIKK